MAKQTVRFNLKGQKKLMKALKGIERDVKRRGMVAAVTSGALIVANEAKRKAPIRTGTLRRSIHVGGASDRTGDFRPGADQREYSEIDKPEVRGDTVTAFVGTNLEYAPYQEFGTRRMAAHPFLRPALDETQNEVRKEMGDVLWSVIERARA